MLKNITLGQYYPVDSPIHRLDPRVKILLAIAMIVAVFLVKTLAGYALILLFVFLVSKLAKVPFKLLVKGLKPLRFILILTFRRTRTRWCPGPSSGSRPRGCIRRSSFRCG